MTPSDAVQKLSELQPDEMARLFTDLGVRGFRSAAMSCAVAQFMKMETGASSVGVDGDGIAFYNEQEDYPTPKSVDEFIRKFDSNHYPELVAG